jgi:hypothetical protein
MKDKTAKGQNSIMEVLSGKSEEIMEIMKSGELMHKACQVLKVKQSTNYARILMHILCHIR